MDCSHNLVTNISNEGCSCTMAYESVIGYGRIEIVSEDEKYHALCLLMKHYQRRLFI